MGGGVCRPPVHAGDGARGLTLPLADFLTVWAFLAANILSPGPNVINTIATAMGSGRVAGFGSAVGVGLGIGIWCLGMSLGMARAFQAFPPLRQLLTLVALGVLCAFAARYLRSAWHGWQAGRLAEPGQRSGQDFGAAFRRSLAVNALNPKALTSWLAILTLFPVARATGGDIAVLWAGACILAFTIHAGYALLFSSPPAARLYLRMGWVVSGSAGLFFAAFAAKLAMGMLAGVSG